MIIKGSVALNHHFPNYSTPKDIDIIGTEDEVVEYCHRNGIWVFKNEYENITTYHGNGNGILYDFEIAEKNRSSVDYLNVMRNVEGELKPASLEVMYSIHKAIIHFDVNFTKHLKTFQLIQSVCHNDHYPEITMKRYHERCGFHTSMNRGVTIYPFDSMP